MAEVRSGPLHLLAAPFVYDAFQTLVGANAWRERVIRERVLTRLGDDSLVVDVGCGTGSVLNWLPSGVRYVGIDRNEAYIEQARSSFSGRNARFHCGDVSAGVGAHESRADVVLAIGLLHHLDDDESQRLLIAIARLLKSGGFLLTLDPVYCESQSFLARAVIRRDRGRSVRTETAYRQLLTSAFRRVEVEIDRTPLRIPYTGIVCTAYL
jgi:SAM-dependent methyltransferase